MRRALKVIGWCAGTVAALFVALLLLTWQYTLYFPEVWGATLTVDGKPSRGPSVYRNRRTGRGLLVRRDVSRKELYAFYTNDEKGFVVRCKDFSAVVVPGLALSNHEQLGQGCFFSNLVLEDSAGHVISEPKKTVQRSAKIGSRLLEFTADDGKRLRAEW
jgi:hypothetical protein